MPEKISVEFVRTKIKYYRDNKTISTLKTDDEVEELIEFLNKKWKSYVIKSSFDAVKFYKDHKKINQRYDYKKEVTTKV